MELRVEDLRIESYHASWTTTLLRVTHIPTGISIDRPKSREDAFAEIEERIKSLPELPAKS